MRTFLTTVLLAALVLAGCAAPPAVPDAAGLALPTAFKEAGATAASVQPGAAWWRAFGDPVLDDLVARAERGNTGIQAAAARVAQARALLGAADAARLPQLGASAGASRSALPGAAPVTALSVGASLSWELDLVGRLSDTSRAAALDAASRDALLQGTRLLVQADVARSYFLLRALDDEIRLVQGSVQTYRDTLRLQQRRFEAGDIPELDVARVRSEAAATEAEALALARQRAAAENALAVLIGEPASSWRLTLVPGAVTVPAVPAGLPSTVLARRPDVQAARQALLAAQARVGIAQNAWWPTLSLTAAGGQASPELADLFKSGARTWGAGALLALPLFDGGARRAGVAQAQAGFDAELARYREQLLLALQDVEDQLAALHWLQAQAGAQAEAVAAAGRVTALSDSRYRNGLVSQLELLDAQRSELRNRRQALQVQAAQWQSTVALIRALGGGWGA